jgi:N-acetylglucosaminyldiphosphoundecaprenol N-acetyl-beta-D-mannosaminyltransferase
VQISATDYAQATDCLIAAACAGVPAIASFQAAHAVVTASGDAKLREIVNSFEMICPDGQPVRWALNLLHRVALSKRVYGPEMMLRLCERAADEQLPIFLYGGTTSVLAALESRLQEKYPGLRVAGSYAPPFRPLTPAEQDDVVRQICDSGARILFIGLGAPKQDLFAYEHRDRLPLVQVCVGAAFDFHAGVKRMAPAWMQNVGLEWLFRLIQEPRRLFKRYAVTNSIFVGKLFFAWCRRDSLANRQQHSVDNADST